MPTETPDELLRAARNQTLYREINEKIESLNASFGETTEGGSSWLCECADPACAEPLQMTLAEYEALRADPNRFAVLPGHVYPAVEHIVEEHERYVVVAKIDAAKDFVVAHDPRAGAPLS
jgi:hypothetical protein